MKIATWNVNSLRVRLPHVLDWLRKEQPDVLAVQETKVVDADFPVLEFAEADYQVAYRGQKTYNGVAVISRETSGDVITDIPGFEDPQRRVLSCRVGGVRVVNVYVPNGSEVGSEKYAYKLEWLAALRGYLEQLLREETHLVLLGDFNIAPADRDVHDPEAWRDRILCSAPERAAFQALCALPLTDLFREMQPEAAEWSWWDYRMNAFKRNIGLRIDHLLVSRGLAELADRCWIDRGPRGLERPSDHAPVVAKFRL